MKTFLQLILAIILIIVATVLWSVFRPQAKPLVIPSMPAQTTTSTTENTPDWLKFPSVPDVTNTTISLNDNGATLTATDTTRIFVDLPEAQYPYKGLTTESHGATFGYISNFDGGAHDKWPFYGEFDLMNSDVDGQVDIVVPGAKPNIPTFRVTVLVHQYYNY